MLTLIQLINCGSLYIDCLWRKNLCADGFATLSKHANSGT